MKGGPLRDMRETFRIGEKEFAAPLWIIGPDVIEDEGFAVEVAHVIAEAAQRRNLPVIFKASYEKANRSSTDSFRGPGLEKGLPRCGCWKPTKGRSRLHGRSRLAVSGFQR